MKTCNRCRIAKDETEFYRDTKSKNQLRTQCKKCRLEYSKKWKTVHPEWGREYQRNNGYVKKRECQWKIRGIKFDGNTLRWIVWKQLLEIQGGVCAICHRDSFWGSLAAEHNHVTNELRGAVCTECNHHAIGIFEKFGHYKSEKHEAILAAYLADPPAEQLKRKLAGVIAE